MPPSTARRRRLHGVIAVVALGAAAAEVVALGEVAGLREPLGGRLFPGEKSLSASRHRATGAALLRVAALSPMQAAAVSMPAQAPPAEQSASRSHWWSALKAGALRSLGVLQDLRKYGWAGYLAAFLSTLVLQIIMPPPFDLSVCWCSLTVCFVYGFSWGFPNIWLAKSAGSVLGFFIFQRIGQARGWDAPQLLRAKLRLMRDRPWATVVPAYIFVPLSPWVKNYGFALCGVDIRPFAVGVLLTFILPCLVEAFVGSSSASLAEAADMDISKKVLEVISKMPVQAIYIAVPSIILLLCAYVLKRYQRKAWGQDLHNSSSSEHGNNLRG